jgi:hypothetical protein
VPEKAFAAQIFSTLYRFTANPLTKGSSTPVAILVTFSLELE